MFYLFIYLRIVPIHIQLVYQNIKVLAQGGGGNNNNNNNNLENDERSCLVVGDKIRNKRRRDKEGG